MLPFSASSGIGWARTADALAAPHRINGKRVCMNIYDTRLVDDWPACGMSWPPDLSDVYSYLRVSLRDPGG
jgi:carboxypeptidase C (cathepsin A)